VSEVDRSAAVAEAAPASHRYLNRELSWLEFNERVLTLAQDEDRPLLERVKFLAITGRNLDEFFQIRVAGLMDQLAMGVVTPATDGMTPGEQLDAIRARVRDQMARQDRLFSAELVPSLAEAGITLSAGAELPTEDRRFLTVFFRDRIYPVLTPLAVDPAHPFPYISNLSLNLAVLVRDPAAQPRRFARVKVPPLLPRFVALEDGKRVVPLEEVIALHLDQLFPGMEIVAHHPFRLTRNADLTLEDEAADLLSAIEEELRRRRRSGQVVRLEVHADMTEEVRELLARELRLERGDLYDGGLLDLGGLWDLYRLDRPDLKERPWSPATQPRLAADGDALPDLFAELRKGDVLVHHPYDSFSTSVEAFVNQAAADPDVLAIKQTLYRTSGEESPIVRALIRAAEAGKQVVALVELKARFDEQSNIAWARALEEAGVHVVYGVVGLKTHAKISLVVRREPDGIYRYAHVGTGNYNPTTAAIYEDVGLLSADPELGSDLTDLFNYLTGYSRKGRYGKLLVSPLTLRLAILELIGREARDGGRIVIKANSLVDTELIDALYEASQAGADIDLVIRGICCLRPGVPEMSDGIRVRSIVGRYLEHSRIFRFGRDDSQVFIGSADLMPRNLDWRVEALTPVTDPDLRARLDEIIDVNLGDDTLAWELQPDGTWEKVERATGVDTHLRLQELATARTRGGTDA
jgi:polyphosphate kinase